MDYSYREMVIEVRVVQLHVCRHWRIGSTDDEKVAVIIDTEIQRTICFPHIECRAVLGYIYDV